MTISKTLMLATVGVLSIGVGAAMAQSDGPSFSPADLYVGPQPGMHAPGVRASQVQSGSSDLDTTRTQRGVTPYDYSDIANPG